MLRFERLLQADEQSFVPRLTTGADAYRHGGSSAIPPTASLFRERFIYDEQPFLRGYERATGRFWRKAAVHSNSISRLISVRILGRGGPVNRPASLRQL